MKTRKSTQSGVSGLMVISTVVLVVSIGAIAYILFSSSKSTENGDYQFPFSLRNRQNARPTTGFGDFGLDEPIPVDEPLSVSDITSTIENELVGTVFADFDDDLSEIDSLINEL